MTRTRKALAVVLGLVAIGVFSLGIIFSHDAPCTPAPALRADAQRIKAIVLRCYGPPDVLKLEDIEKPAPGDNQVLVKVHAASVNPLDWHAVRGTPYISRKGRGLYTPTETRLGVDYSGTVEAVGKDVTAFKPGDEVFGGRDGSFAQYIVQREAGSLVLKPAGVTFEQAASAPVASMTALQALRDHGQLKPGQKVLINGASGGVGTFGVQIAKYLGAEVTGVCSTKNVDMVRSLGADHVIDYTKKDFTEGEQRYDLVFDTVGNRSLRETARVITPGGTLVIIGAPKDRWLSGFARPLRLSVASRFLGQKLLTFRAQMNKDDLTLVGNLMAEGKITPVIDRRYKLSEVPQAVAYVEEGHARGKVIIEVE
jgi:NADPH:quinone reductase-like Zn-dependent oxidoreductase